jgi:hypothetical protein
MPKGAFPNKDVLADSLDDYASHFNMPILRGVRVTNVALQAGDFIVECGVQTFSCANVIVAAEAYWRPWIPNSSALLDSSIHQVNSSGYRRPADVVGEHVLVVGFGTSGIEIAIELAAAGRRVFLSGRPAAQALSKFVPAIFEGKNPILRLIGAAYWNFMHRVVTIDTPLGEKPNLSSRFGANRLSDSIGRTHLLPASSMWHDWASVKEGKAFFGKAAGAMARSLLADAETTLPSTSSRRRPTTSKIDRRIAELGITLPKPWTLPLGLTIPASL